MFEEPGKYGRYIVRCVLGEGSMGRVYLADDPVLQRKVALKVIKLEQPHLTQTDQSQYLKRFFFEARASAKLDHPSIVTVYDAGEEKGLPWIAFQYIDGKSLDDFIKSQMPITIEEALSYTLDIASALQHAHKLNIIHRDIKPSNILVDSKSGIAKISDFGIAKVPWVALTRHGNVLGSPGYMSPEQISGFELDSRSDIFSLGIVLYQMICGKHPFIRNDIPGTIYATLNGDFVPLCKLVPGLPNQWDLFVSKCLAVNREERVSSASECISFLHQFHDLCNQSVRHRHFKKNQMMFSEEKKSSPSIITKNSIQHWYRSFRTALLSGYHALSNFAQKARMNRTACSVRKLLSRSSISLNQKGSSVHSVMNWIFEKGKLFVRMIYQKWYPRIEHIADRTKKIRKYTVPARPWTIGILLCMVMSAMYFSTTVVLKKRRIYPSEAPYSSRSTGVTIDKAALEQVYRGKTLLTQNNIQDSVPVVEKIIQNLDNSPETSHYAYLFRAVISLTRQKYEHADSLLKELMSVPGADKVVRNELPFLLTCIKPELKRAKAPQTLIDMIAGTLLAATHDSVYQWKTDKQYWLRWNAVQILETADLTIDTVPVYILDLQYGASIRTRVRAARKLGESDDPRAITALQEASKQGFGDPFVAIRARRILEQKGKYE